MIEETYKGYRFKVRATTFVGTAAYQGHFRIWNPDGEELKEKGDAAGTFKNEPAAIAAAQGAARARIDSHANV